MRSAKLLSHRAMSWFHQDQERADFTPAQLDADASLLDNNASTSPARNDAGLVLMVGGVAGAVGEDTFTSGEVFAEVNDHGRVTVGKGYALFSAAAESATDAPSAFAETYANASGADFIITISLDTAGARLAGSGETAGATSLTRIIAIDFEDFDMPGGPRIVDLSARMPALQVAHLGTEHGGCGGNHHGQWLTGNIATVSADAVAHGGSSIALTDTFSLTGLTGTNAFSFVSGDAISGVA
jgi:hypothetical protein